MGEKNPKMSAVEYGTVSRYRELKACMKKKNGDAVPEGKAIGRQN